MKKNILISFSFLTISLLAKKQHDMEIKEDKKKEITRYHWSSAKTVITEKNVTYFNHYKF